MQFQEVIKDRFSCRNYSGKEVSPETLRQIMEAVHLAPSACNRQPWRFIVISRPDDGEGRKAVIDSYNRQWIETAPVYIIACGLPGEAWVRPFDGKNHTDVDVSIAVEHLCLAATSLGLGTCWVCNFDPAVLRQGLGLGEELDPIAIIPLGYPAEGTVVPEKKRKDYSEIVVCR